MRSLPMVMVQSAVSTDRNRRFSRYNSFLATHKAAGDNGAYTFYDGIGGFSAFCK